MPKTASASAPSEKELRMILSADDMPAIERAINLRFEALIRQQLVEMISELSSELEGVSKRARWEIFCRSTLRNHLEINSVKTDADRIAIDASVYYRRHADGLSAELPCKMALLSQGKLTNEGCLTFAIEGERAGRPMRIELRMLLDLDRHGMPTHDFTTMIFNADRRAAKSSLDQLAA